MSTIHVVGSLNADFVISVPRLVRAGETISGSDLRLFPGGKGANQAVAAGKLGARVRMVGQVGRDAQGEFLIQSVKRAGVDTRGVGRSEGASGAAWIQVLPTGENAIVISPGANATLTPEDIRLRLGSVRESDCVLCQLETPLETVEEALRVARTRGALAILDPAPAQHLRPSLLRLVDILTPNETEAACLLGTEAVDAPGALEHLECLGAPRVVLKSGQDGAWISDGTSRHHLPAIDVETVDTTAAGDTFNAALAVGLSEGQSFLQAARFASAAAAVSVTRHGAQTSCPTRSEAQAVLSRVRPKASTRLGASRRQGFLLT